MPEGGGRDERAEPHGRGHGGKAGDRRPGIEEPRSSATTGP